MLTPKDLENPDRKSGYNHVGTAGHNSQGQGRVKWMAYIRDRGGLNWNGPRRNYARLAAQDYCDYVNGKGVPSAPQLKSAGHKSKRPRLPDDPEVQAALGVIKDARGAQAGNQGFVYLICETDAYTGSVDLLQGYAKIGFSTNPEARVAELQTGNPRKLRLMSYFPGTEEDERKMQQHWINYNVLQEWFHLTPALVLTFHAQKGSVRP